MLKSKSGGEPFIFIQILHAGMNYLAHAHLSFNQPQLLVGNMISDFIKGKKQFDYPPGILKGIQLHRAIDNFTDMHPVTQELKAYFRPAYRLYSGAFADIVYDHFLALDTTQFSSDESLRQFAAGTYATLEQYYPLTPFYFQQLFPYMKEHDWLYNYRFTWGIERSFKGLVRRAVYLEESHTAYTIFLSNYDAMRSCYEAFYPLLKKYAAHHLPELTNS